MDELVKETSAVVETKPADQNSGRSYADYTPLELNLGVFFSPRNSPYKTSISLNYIRGYVVLKFSMTTDAGTTEKVTRKMSLNQAFLFSHALRAVVADRMAIASSFYKSGFEDGGGATVPQYSVLNEENFTFKTSFFDKEKKELVNSGKITISTIEYEGVQRIVITGYSNTGMQKIPVIIAEDMKSANEFHQVSPTTVVDAADVSFFRFAMEIERALKSTFIYAGFDKIYQTLIYRNNNGTGSAQIQNNQKKGFFGFKKQQNQISQRTVAVNDSGPSEESGADLFDTDVDF